MITNYSFYRFFKGGWMGLSFLYLMMNNGFNNASTYPYKGVKKSCQFDSNKSAGDINSFEQLPFFDEELLKNALATIGPLSTAIDGSQEAFFNYYDGIYDDPYCTQYLTHAVLLDF